MSQESTTLPATHGALRRVGALRRAVARAGLMVATALVLKETVLGPVAEKIGDWAPPLFLLALGGAGIAFQRLFRTPGARWGTPRGRAGHGANLVLPILLLLPPLFGAAYTTAIGAGAAEGGWTVAALLGTAMYVVATPVVEEFYFRHLLHRELARVFQGPLAIVLANAVWFAAMHVPYNMPVALVTGVCCTALRVRTGGIGWPMLAHAATNLALAVLQH